MKLQESVINFDVKETMNMDNNDFYKENGSFDSKDKNILNPKSRLIARNRMSKIDTDGLASNNNNIGGILN